MLQVNVLAAVYAMCDIADGIIPAHCVAGGQQPSIVIEAEVCRSTMSGAES
jgi:hypothetical protein